MAVTALGELDELIKSGKDIKPCLKVIAETGFLPYDKETLEMASKILYEKYKEWSGKVSLEICDVDKSLYDAGKSAYLQLRPDQVVKRVVSRKGLSKNAETRALKILEKAKCKIRAKKFESWGAAAIYETSNMTQREICNVAFCTESSLREARKRLKKIAPEYFKSK